jgi:hypothetical protein
MRRFDVPGNRFSEFDPQLIKKNQPRFAGPKAAQSVFCAETEQPILCISCFL